MSTINITTKNITTENITTENITTENIVENIVENITAKNIEAHASESTDEVFTVTFSSSTFVGLPFYDETVSELSAGELYLIRSAEHFLVYPSNSKKFEKFLFGNMFNKNGEVVDVFGQPISTKVLTTIGIMAIHMRKFIKTLMKHKAYRNKEIRNVLMRVAFENDAIEAVHIISAPFPKQEVSDDSTSE